MTNRTITKRYLIEEITTSDQDSDIDASQELDAIKQVAHGGDNSLGRINPQLSCTIEPSDKDILDELSLYACNKEKKMLNTSIVVRALIRFGWNHKDKLTF